MSRTKIQWADESLNPLVGCSKISAGCFHCYAAKASATPRLQQFKQYQGVVDERGEWTGKINFVPSVLDNLVKRKKPCTIFMPSMSDPFHPAVSDEWLDQIFAAIALVPHITIMMLTKRPKRMYEYMNAPTVKLGWASFMEKRTSKPTAHRINSFPLTNLMLGVSVENQAAANERIPWLLKTPAAKRFLSVEPLLEYVDLRGWDEGKYFNPGLGECERWIDPLNGRAYTSLGDGTNTDSIDLVICGGESGKNARPFNLDWARSIKAQCEQSRTDFFLKQLGSNPVLGGEPLNLRDRKGGNEDEWPEDLRNNQ